MLKNDVFERQGDDTLSRRGFYLALASVLTWGFFATAAVADKFSAWQPSLMEVIVVGLVIPIVGILIGISKNPVISFIGYNMVVIPFGMTLGPVLAQYELAQPGIVTSAAITTGAVTVVMGASGVLYPRVYANMGGALFTALIALLVVRILGMFIPALGNSTIVDYLAAGLFSLYIGYDMYRASTIPATLDNAVDVGLSLYLDIINLFLNILRIMAKAKE